MKFYYRTTCICFENHVYSIILLSELWAMYIKKFRLGSDWKNWVLNVHFFLNATLPEPLDRFPRFKLYTFYWVKLVSTLNLDLDFRSPNRPQKQVSQKVIIHHGGKNNWFFTGNLWGVFFKTRLQSCTKKHHLTTIGKFLF